MFNCMSMFFLSTYKVPLSLICSARLLLIRREIMNQKRVLAILDSPHVNEMAGSMLNYSRPYPEKDREMLGEAGEYEMRLKSQDI